MAASMETATGTACEEIAAGICPLSGQREGIRTENRHLTEQEEGTDHDYHIERRIGKGVCTGDVHL